MNKKYLGDGVYVSIDRGMVRLSTEDGIRTTNVIYLEEEVLNAFFTWWVKANKGGSHAAPDQ